MAAELKIHRGCTIDHIEVAVHGETRPCKYHTIPFKRHKHELMKTREIRNKE
jgi:hypothetical protein